MWPRVWAGDRRRRLVLLVGAGVAQAALAGAAAVLVSRSLRAPDPYTRDAAFGLLLSVALLGGLLRAVERIVAERLGQSYVHQVRVLLLTASLSGEGSSSLGVTVSRATNDLTALKNWLTLGLAPLVVGIPAVVGVLAALAFTAPVLALAAAMPIGVMAVIALLLTPVGYARSRAVRRHRGRLSARVADTMLASDSIRSAGGVERELRRLSGVSREVADASIARAETAGALRGVGVAAATATSAVVVWSGAHAGLSTAGIAGALTVVGFLTGPLHDLARVVDQRQSYRAARRALGPGLPARPAASGPPRLSSAAAVPTTAGAGRSGTHSGEVIVGPFDLDGASVPATRFGAADRVFVRGSGRHTTVLLATLGGVRDSRPGQLLVDGLDLAVVSGHDRRRLVGYASGGMALVPGSIARIVGYRTPGDDGSGVAAALERVGLSGCIDRLEGGLRTRIARDGSPLTRDERARMILARALVGAPPLLVLDHLDRDLGPEGVALLCDVVADYPGVVVMASDTMEAMASAVGSEGNPNTEGPFTTRIWGPSSVPT